MKRIGPTPKIKKVMRNLVDKNPEYSTMLPFFLYPGSPLRRLDDLALLLNETPYDGKVEKIIEALVTQSPSEMEWSEETSHTGVGLSRLLISPGSRLSPAPGSPLDIFNSLVMRTPFILRFVGYKNNKTGAIKIEAGRSPISIDGFAAYLETGRIERKTDYTEEALWLIWEIYFREIGLERLKRCPQCQHWFVDRTRNKQKERCSQRCTWQWWSWSKRKEEGHNLPELKKTKPRKTKMGK